MSFQKLRIYYVMATLVLFFANYCRVFSLNYKELTSSPSNGAIH